MHTHPSILKSKLNQPLAFLSRFHLYIIMVVLCRSCLVIIVLMFVFLVCFLCNDIGRKGCPPPGIMFFFLHYQLTKIHTENDAQTSVYCSRYFQFNCF